jgi:hypothetical protein
MIFIQVYDFECKESLTSYRNIIAIVCIIASIAGVASYFDFANSRKYAGDLPRKIDSVESQNFQAISFLATYIVPIAFINFMEWRHAANALLLIVIIGAIFVKTNLYYTNPILTVLGFNLYKATFGNAAMILISRFHLEKNDSVKLEWLGDDVYYVRRKGNS